MKVAVILTYQVSAGGGFNQALNAILQMKALSKGEFDFVVYTNIEENFSYLAKLDIKVKSFLFGWKDKFLAYCVRNDLARKIQAKIKLIGRMEQAMLEDSVDLVYFVTPSSLCLSLQKLNYITTVWDLCHRDTPEFPEVRNYCEFHTRESLYKNSLAPSVLVLTDSTELSNRIVSRYGVDKDKLLSMPFGPGPFTTEEYSKSKVEVLKKYRLEEAYYFYPAQFWPHKNHIRILQALSQLAEEGIMRQVVFSGSDQGNIEHIKNVALKLGVLDRIKFIGFIPAEDMRGLYEGCLSVVMPTYFGPTNLPPLEAWSIGKPLIYSSHLYQQVGDAALLVDPDDSSALAKAMKDVTRVDVAEELVQKGKKRLLEIHEERAEAELQLLNVIKRFALRRDCWS